MMACLARWSRRTVLRGAAAAKAALLIACAGPADPGQRGGGPPAVSGTVEFAHTISGPTDLKWETDIMERFAQRYPAVKLALLQLGSPPTTQIVALSAAGTPPDIYLLNNDLAAFYANQNLLQPLDAFLARDRVDREDYLPLALRTYQVKATQAAIPYDLNSAGIYVNRTHFQQAGLAVPTKNFRDASWTVTDLLETARKLTRTGADAAAKQFGYLVDTWIARWFPFLWGNGGDVFDSVNDPKGFTFISRETEQTMQWLVDLRFQHLVSPQPVDLTGTTGLNLFRAGRIAMFQENMSLIPQMDAVSGLQWDVVPVTRGPKGRFTRVAGAGLGIHPGSKNKEGGWAYLKFHGTAEAWSLAKGQKYTIPPTRSAGAVALDGVAPETRRLWLDTLEYGRTQALHLKWTELMEGDGARKLYTQALNGEVSVQAALDQIKRYAEAVLG